MNRKIIITLALVATLSLGTALTACQPAGSAATTTTQATSSSKETETSKTDGADKDTTSKETTNSTSEASDKEGTSKSGFKGELSTADTSGIISAMKDGELTITELDIQDDGKGTVKVGMGSEERTIQYDANTLFQILDLGTMDNPKEDFIDADISSLRSDSMIYVWGKEVDGKFVAERIVMNNPN